METRPAQSRLLLRIAAAIADSKVPISSPDQAATDKERTEVIPEAGWDRLGSLAARFEAELAYAGSCLDDELPPSTMETLLASSSELRRVAILQRYVDK